MTSATMQAEAREILKTMESDVALVPDHLAEWWGSYLRFHSERYIDTLGFIEGFDRDLLEIGSVPCHFTLLLKKLGYNVRGMDLAPERIGAFLEKHELGVDKVDIETDAFPFPDSSFGTVVFLEVLEHLRINPLNTFRELARVLKPGGRLLISTPNITPAHRMMYMMGRDFIDVVAEFRKIETLGHMGHIRLYSLGDIEAFLNEFGLRLESYSLEGEYDTPNWKSKLLWALHPKKSRFRTYTYVVASKPA